MVLDPQTVYCEGFCFLCLLQVSILVLDCVRLPDILVSPCTPSCGCRGPFLRVLSPFVSLIWVVCPPSRGSCVPSYQRCVRLPVCTLHVGGVSASPLVSPCTLTQNLKHVPKFSPIALPQESGQVEMTIYRRGMCRNMVMPSELVGVTTTVRNCCIKRYQRNIALPS